MKNTFEPYPFEITKTSEKFNKILEPRFKKIQCEIFEMIKKKTLNGDYDVPGWQRRDCGNLLDAIIKSESKYLREEIYFYLSKQSKSEDEIIKKIFDYLNNKIADGVYKKAN